MDGEVGFCTTNTMRHTLESRRNYSRRRARWNKNRNSKPTNLSLFFIGGYEIGERPRQLGKQFSCGSRHHTSANVSRTDRHRAHLKEDCLFSLANKMFGHMTHYGYSARAGYNKDDTCTSLPF